MRRGNENSSNVPEIVRHSGAPNDDEIQKVRQAYENGCKGEILIGLRGEERVLTMLLPAQSDADAADVLAKTIDKFRQIGCDRAIRIRRRYNNDESADKNSPHETIPGH